ncbi:MAG: Mut7-C RNAse domain-containing protein [Desulfobacterota bacterium]|nr:Mut7-C RNAse domain-containing protein [Thermodesulfobacteriota bacterium]
MFIFSMRLWLSPHLAYLKKTLRMLGLDVRIRSKSRSGWLPNDRFIHPDRYPSWNTEAGAITLKTETEAEQVREILQALDLRPDPDRLLGRCLRCNLPLTPLQSEDLAPYRDQIPVYILQTQRHFNRCPGCGRIYWPGTHARNMLARLQELGLVE